MIKARVPLGVGIIGAAYISAAYLRASHFFGQMGALKQKLFNDSRHFRTMADHLRFSVAYWHTFRKALSDPFGVGTAIRLWDDGSPSVENARHRVYVAFEFIEKLGTPFYAFHDRDVAPEGASLAESNRNFDQVVQVLKEEQQRTGIKLLWATACLFINPRFVHGAATSSTPAYLPTRRRK